MFNLVRDDVMEMTNNQQQPFAYGSVSGQIGHFGSWPRHNRKIDAAPRARKTTLDRSTASRSATELRFLFAETQETAKSALHQAQSGLVCSPSRCSLAQTLAGGIAQRYQRSR